MNFYSQSGEDKWLADRWHELGLREEGNFVDVGAGDGVHLSNTKWLEDRGWHGLCIEPDLSVVSKLFHNRRCAIAPVAVSSIAQVRDFICHEHFELSGFLRTESVKNRRIRVQAVRLDELLDAYGFVLIDVLSIDTEGTEIDVLDSANLSRVNILIVEHDTTGLPSNKEALMARLTPEFKLLETFPYNFIFQRIK